MKIVIAAFDDGLPSGVVGVADMFYLAAQAYRHTPQAAKFVVCTASADGKPIHDARGRKLAVDAAFADIERCDAILIPGIVPDAHGLQLQTAAIAKASGWLREQHARGAWVGASCSGVFVLGEAGLLNGRRCTTTWWLHDELKARYPRADTAWGAAIIEDGRVVSSGGPLSWVDLALHVIRVLAGPEAARVAADFAVVDTAPLSQSLYVPRGHVTASDPFLIDAERAVRQARDENLTAEALAAQMSTSARTLHRRLKALTGEAPKAFITRIRLENARTLLETGGGSIKEIVQRSGYVDESSFRRAFRRFSDMTPSGYRDWSRARRGVAA